MKKFLSAIIALTMIATTFVSSAFAAGTVNVAATADKDTYKAGEDVVISLKLSGAPMCAFTVVNEFDNEVFQYVGITSNIDVTSTPAKRVKKTVKATASKDENFGKDVDIQFNFKVNSDAKAGEYTFKIYDPLGSSFQDEDGVSINQFLDTTFNDVTVKIGEDKPAEVAAEFDTKAASKFTYGDVYNYGIGGAVTVPEGKSTTGVTFDISNGTQTKNYDFDFGTSIAADTSFGLNIYRVPVGVELSFSNLQVK